jgi:hypothetical protein
VPGKLTKQQKHLLQQLHDEQSSSPRAGLGVS